MIRPKNQAKNGQHTGHFDVSSDVYRRQTNDQLNAWSVYKAPCTPLLLQFLTKAVNLQCSLTRPVDYDLSRSILTFCWRLIKPVLVISVHFLHVQVGAINTAPSSRKEIDCHKLKLKVHSNLKKERLINETCSL